MASKDYSKKKFFTTGQIAKICGVSIATVQKWIDAGEVNSYRLPLTGSERRVPRESLLAFMKKYNVPTSELEDRLPYRVLAVISDKNVRKHVDHAWDGIEKKPEFYFTEDGGEALLQAGYLRPDIMILDLNVFGPEGMKIVELLLKDASKDQKIIIVSEVSDTDKTRLEELGVPMLSKDAKPTKLKNFLLKAAGLSS